MPHVDAFARVDEEGHRDLLLLVIELRDGIDLGEGIALDAQPVLDQLLRGRDHLLVVDLALLHQHQLLQVLQRHDGLAGDAGVGDLVDLAFLHADRDEHVVLLGRDGHLRGLDVHVRVATVLVPGLELLEVAGQRFPGIARVLLPPVVPLRRLQLEALEDVLFLELGVADDVDLADAGAGALLDVDLDPHAVVGLLLDLGVDGHAVLAAAEILLGEVATQLLEDRAVEGLARGKTQVAQALGELLGLEVLVALQLEALDRGPLLHHHDQRVAIAPQLDVAEEAGGVQRAHGLAQALRAQVVADVDGQVVVDRALRHALQAFDTDVADREARIARIDLLRAGNG